MANYVKLINDNITGSTGVKLAVLGSITYGWQNLVSADPTNTAFDKTEVQFNGWENPIINLSFAIPIEDNPSGFITWATWNSIVKNEYIDSSTLTKLQVVVGSADTSLTSYATSTSTTLIPVQVKGFTLNLGAGDSNDANFWIINAQFIETK
jgi:hypothetical protein